MELRIWKRIFLGPFIRLNFYNRAITISFGHRNLGWLTFSAKGITATKSLLPGVYVTERRRWPRGRP